VETAFAQSARSLTIRSETKEVPHARTSFVVLCAILLSILHAALAVTAGKSPTFDEPVHLTAGYSYWLRQDFRLDQENGNLPARWAALPLLATRPNFPEAESLPWKKSFAGESSRQFFYKSGNDPDQMLWQGRLMMSVFGGGVCLLIFFWARQIFGTTGGFISETLAVFDPNLLAHSGLVTSDVAAAVFFTAAVWSTWLLLGSISPRTLALAVLAIAGLFLTKMSAPLFLIMAATLTGLRIFSSKPIQIEIVDHILREKIKKAAVIGGLAMVIGATVVFATWASYCFRFSAVTDNGLPRQMLDARWSRLADDSLFTRWVAMARDHHLLPEAYLYGLAYTHKRSQYRPAFLDGRWSNVGFASFFPRAFAYKTPLPVFGMILMGCAAATLRWRRSSTRSPFPAWQIIRSDLMRLAPMGVLLVVYSAFALSTNLNIGHRHLLPVYPAIFIACGACAYFFRNQGLRLCASLVVLLLGWQSMESLLIRPHYLAYFNQVAGGPANGSKHLVDSSLDWGQDLSSLNTWLAEHKAPLSGKSVYLGYFGTADPTWYQVPATALPEADDGLVLSPLRGGLYCISATVLQHVYETERGTWAKPYEEAYQKAAAQMLSAENARSPEAIKNFQRLRFARLCAYLRHREPIAKIGYSIFVFALTDENLREALLGPPAELANQIEVIER
jgi:hypothetical protein